MVTAPRDRVRDNGINTDTQSYDVMVSNLKVGLTNSMDLQLVLTPYHYQSVRAGNSESHTSNFGDTVVRLKYNLVGNDGGDFSAGLMPFVKLPTHTGDDGNRNTEGGLIVPFGFSLPKDFSLGMMAQFNHSKSEGAGFQTDFIASVTLGHDLYDDVGGYVELYGEQADISGAGFISTLDFGFTYGFTKDIQFDIGVNLGLSEAADDLNPFLGFSARY